MNLRDLEYVVAIAEQGQFGRAASACHVSQSTLSVQVKKLEDFLGVPVFERDNKHVMATPVGEPGRFGPAARLLSTRLLGMCSIRDCDEDHDH